MIGLEIGAPRASRDHATKVNASSATHLSQWSLCTYLRRKDLYVERAMRVVDSTKLYRVALDLSSLGCPFSTIGTDMAGVPFALSRTTVFELALSPR